MSDAQYQEGGGDLPAYQEDFFQRIVNVSWQKGAWGINAGFENAMQFDFNINPAQVEISGGPKSPSGVKSPILGFDGTVNNVHVSKTYTKNGVVVGEAAFNQSITSGGSGTAGVDWGDQMGGFTSKKAALKWKPFGGATTLSFTWTISIRVPDPDVFLPMCVASFTISGFTILSGDPKGPTVVGGNKLSDRIFFSPYFTGFIADRNTGEVIGTVPIISSVSFSGTYNLTNGRATGDLSY